MDSSTDKVRCPNCRAVQDWSDTCRRCKSDLTLLWSVKLSADESRRLCLLALDEDRPYEALEHARQCFRVTADQNTARLMAVCSLHCGLWANALQYAQLAIGEAS